MQTRLSTATASALLLIGGAAVSGIQPALAAGSAGEYGVINKTPAADGGYDYVSVDSAAQRLFMARNDGVMIVDLKTNKVTPRFVAGEEVAAVLIIPDSELMLSTNWESGKATLFNRHTGQIKAKSGKDKGSVQIGKGADGAIFDASRRVVFIPSNNGTLSVLQLDASGGARLAQQVITHEGARTAAFDPTTDRLYLPSANFVDGKEGKRTRVPGTFAVLVVGRK